MVWTSMPRILLLDDDATFLNAVTAFIMAARTDIAIDTAMCAEAGLLLIGTTPYDAIVSDYRMSGLDGLQLVKECVRLRPGTPVLLITGDGDSDMEADALQAGAYAFMHKPVPPDILLSLVDRALHAHRVKESAWWDEPEGWSDASMSCVIERDRLFARVQEIDRLIRK